MGLIQKKSGGAVLEKLVLWLNDEITNTIIKREGALENGAIEKMMYYLGRTDTLIELVDKIPELIDAEKEQVWIMEETEEDAEDDHEIGGYN